MIKTILKNNIFFAFCVLVLTLATLQGCNDKKGGDNNTNNSDTQNSDLIKKDSAGSEKITLLMKPKKGDKFTYKMLAKTTSKENSPVTQSKDFTTEQEIIYFYTQEVDNIESSNIISFKIKFDSIKITSKIASPDSTISMVYNSNIKDSIYSKPDFIQYNSIINEEFFMRVSPEGEVTDVYGLEKVYDNIFKGFGDTLREKDKSAVKESFGSDVKAKLQQQFQMFPKNEVMKDSSWTRTYESEILVFPVRNNLSYKVINMKTENNETLITIDASMNVDFLEKEFKDRNITSRITDSNSGGKGTVIFNLTRGCIVKKETNTNIDLTMKLSAGGQSANSTQNVSTLLIVELLNNQPLSQK